MRIRFAEQLENSGLLNVQVEERTLVLLIANGLACNTFKAQGD